MANHHVGKFADVWKHLVLCEVLDGVRPSAYAETHAGSAAYEPVDDPERRFGLIGFLDATRSSGPLERSAYSRTLRPLIEATPARYPGSALLAMSLLGDLTSYLLCDLDPRSTDDLRSWAARLGLSDVEVIENDGMSSVSQWLPAHSVEPAVVHVDPFDPYAAQTGGMNAVQLAADAARRGAVVVYWYGYSAPDRRGWARREIGELTDAPLWCGDMMIVDTAGVGQVGDLGEATTPGTGLGLVVANADPTTTRSCARLGTALADAYRGCDLPNGAVGGLDFETT